MSWQAYLTPAVVGTGFTTVCGVLVYLLNHKSGKYADELKTSIATQLAVQTVAVVKNQVECKDEIVAAVKSLKA